MALTFHTAHRSSSLQVQLVRCRPHGPAHGELEQTTADLISFPLRGVFVMHYGRRREVVADRCRALLLRAGRSFRVSHPVDGGDECLVIEPSRELWHELQPAGGDPRTHAALDPRVIAARRVLVHRIARGLASELEIEETALGLAGDIAAGELAPAASPAPAWRAEERVEATRITLAAQPGLAWSLGELAARVASSPFRLARTFREIAGIPVHRYHLLARMAAALDQVLDSSRDMTAIGFELGFSSHSHFTATFRRMFGMPPSRFRARASSRSAAEARALLVAARS